MSKHLDADKLAALAISGAAPPTHVAGCETCSAQLLEFETLVGGLRAMPEPPADLAQKAVAYFQRRVAIDALIARLAEDPALRAKLNDDPNAALRGAGLEPTPELIAAFRDVGRSDSGATERLAARLWF